MFERKTLAPIRNIFKKELGFTLVAGLDNVFDKPSGYGVQVNGIFIFPALLVVVLEMPADRLLMDSRKAGNDSARGKT